MPANNTLPLTILADLTDVQIAEAARAAGEPEWLIERREAAWRFFAESLPPVWKRTDLSKFRSEQIAVPLGPQGTAVQLTRLRDYAPPLRQRQRRSCFRDDSVSANRPFTSGKARDSSRCEIKLWRAENWILALVKLRPPRVRFMSNRNGRHKEAATSNSVLSG